MYACVLRLKNSTKFIFQEKRIITIIMIMIIIKKIEDNYFVNK